MNELISIPADIGLMPTRRNPYYIVSPGYTHQSAGIKSLHLLCHALNRRGQLAFMVKQDIWKVMSFKKMALNPDWQTPELTRDIYKAHQKSGVVPIVVYPEIFAGNPLEASVVVRYVLNFPGLLGGDKEYPPEEIVFAYSHKLAAAAHVGADRVLFIPASDTNVFHRPAPHATRSGSCFYAAKYQQVHKGKLFDVTRDSLEITRGKKSQSPQEIADLFRRSELFYCYENSALAIEAMLCGCPTVFLPNAHLTEIIAAEELGTDGFAWGADPAEVNRARETVGLALKNYLHTYTRFWEQLEAFIEITSARATSVELSKQTLPLHAPVISIVESLSKSLLHRIRDNSLLRKPRRLLNVAAYLLMLYLIFEMGAYYGAH